MNTIDEKLNYLIENGTGTVTKNRDISEFCTIVVNAQAQQSELYYPQIDNKEQLIYCAISAGYVGIRSNSAINLTNYSKIRIYFKHLFGVNCFNIKLVKDTGENKYQPLASSVSIYGKINGEGISYDNFQNVFIYDSYIEYDLSSYNTTEYLYFGMQVQSSTVGQGSFMIEKFELIQ